MNINEQNYLKSIELIGEQIKQSYNEAGKIALPESYKQVNKVVVCGMGGSQLGVDLLNSLFKEELLIPTIQIRDYSLPGFVDDKTLILLISYSGTTEEVLTIASKLKNNDKVVAIATGGKLAEVAKDKNWPLYQFEPINNPSAQPRMGTGYTIGSVMAILQNLNFLKISSSQLEEMFKAYPVEVKKLAGELKNKVPVIITAEHLSGNAHIIANQINESAKQRCYFFQLPELNHHLLEGLAFPKKGLKNLVFVFFYSKNYNLRVQKRFVITRRVLTKQKIKFLQLDLQGSRMAEAMQMLTMGSMLSYELSKLNKVDPASIPWVNYFKEQLGQ